MSGASDATASVELAEALKTGDRRALARAITLIESTRTDHQMQAQALLETLLPATGGAIRLGITGVPGVGKSTFIEAFGLHAIGEGRKVAVLAVDPSSTRTGGSILGDKTRMQQLSQHEHAFIRPSPTAGSLGGVARRTREATLLCEAAGFDLIVVETVGVGQSETEVADMVDMFLLMLLPSGGDELQGIKKGIVELADLIVINKADGDLAGAARMAQASYASALRLLTPSMPHWTPKVLAVSALARIGIGDVWQAVLDYRQAVDLPAHRASQARRWLWKEIREGLMEGFLADSALQARLAEIERRVMSGDLPPTRGARSLLDSMRSV